MTLSDLWDIEFEFYKKVYTNKFGVLDKKGFEEHMRKKGEIYLAELRSRSISPMILLPTIGIFSFLIYAIIRTL